jgi:hypothetical protein
MLTTRQVAAGVINEAVADFLFDLHDGATDDLRAAQHRLAMVTPRALKAATAVRSKAKMKQPAASWPCSRHADGDPLPELATLHPSHGEALAVFLRLQLTVARSEAMLALIGPFYNAMSRGEGGLDVTSPAVIDAYSQVLRMVAAKNRTLRADLAHSGLTAAELLRAESDHWARNAANASNGGRNAA